MRRTTFTVEERTAALRQAENNLGVVASAWLDLKALGLRPEEMRQIDADVVEHEAKVKRAARRLRDTQRRLEKQGRLEGV